MKRRTSLLLAIVTFGLFCRPEAAEVQRAARPNLILILTDDQGYGDASCHGHPILKTPNLDRLHREGVRFEDFQVSPTCSPTRSSLLSGKHEFKNGVTHTIYERERMSLKSTTLAQVLKSAGYTTGIFGKWHLGDEEAYQPQNRGFDEAYDRWWSGILPCLENEQAHKTAPRVNPFKEWYWKQYNGPGPNQAPADEAKAGGNDSGQSPPKPGS